MFAGTMRPLGQLALRLLLSATGVASITFVAHKIIPGNPTTVGFAYLLFVLIVASTWGFVKACLSSILAALAFNFFFLPPLGTFTISDPQNWVALFSFLATSLIASRLSDRAKQRTRYAVERQQDVERLYTFSRTILLLDNTAPLPKQLVQKLSEIFGLTAAILYDRRSAETYRAGASDPEGLQEQLRDAALNVWLCRSPVDGSMATEINGSGVDKLFISCVMKSEDAGELTGSMRNQKRTR